MRVVGSRHRNQVGRCDHDPVCNFPMVLWWLRTMYGDIESAAATGGVSLRIEVVCQT